eukprot:13502598-Alexandrium_andersonii.AAC.1
MHKHFLRTPRPITRPGGGTNWAKVATLQILLTATAKFRATLKHALHTSLATGGGRCVLGAMLSGRTA